MTRPNILLIVADQLTPFLTGAYGHPVVKTPNLNRLVNEGVRFDSAYSPNPVCAPARACLMTGRQASNNKVWDNSAPLACDVPCVAHYMTNAGYDTVASGKMHFVGPDQLHGFKRRLTTDIYPSDFEWLTLCKRDKSERVLNRKPSFARNYCLPNVGVRPWSTTMAYDEMAHAQGLDYINGRALARSELDPFFLCVSYQYPHEPFHPTQELWDLYDDDEIDIPEYPDDLESTYSVMDRWLNIYHCTDQVDIKQPESLRALRRAYYALVTYVDRKVGELLEALERTGQLENTVILFTADHGDMLAEKNMVQKRTFYEWSCRVPLIMRFPDGQHSGETIAEPVSLVDVAPTILDLAGAPETRPMDGTSLLPCLDHVSLDRVVFAELHSDWVYSPCFMARRDQYKYVYVHEEDEQLFDLDSDPGEWHNLADLPEYRQIVNELRSSILDRFDPDAIEQEIRGGLLDREIIRETMRINNTNWDYSPYVDPSSQFARRSSNKK